MNRYDIAAIVIVGVVVIGLMVGLFAFAMALSDFADKTNGSD